MRCRTNYDRREAFFRQEIRHRADRPGFTPGLEYGLAAVLAMLSQTAEDVERKRRIERARRQAHEVEQCVARQASVVAQMRAEGRDIGAEMELLNCYLLVLKIVREQLILEEKAYVPMYVHFIKAKSAFEPWLQRLLWVAAAAIAISSALLSLFVTEGS